ncbi:MAG: electron transport complex subunit RsxC [Gammaproteobacteria bacterium]|nr:electron transport complex subunit RsxC [Gammaproteobacteria bacterium]
MNSVNRKLWKYNGGLHLEDHKTCSNQMESRELPMPKRLTIPMQQHIGEAAHPIVKVGDKVLKGEMIAESSARVSAPIHAPTSGTIVEIAPMPMPHPAALDAVTIILESDGLDQWCELHPIENYRHVSSDELRDRIRDAGIVGLGGAGFPSYIKLDPGQHFAIETLILNGAECEPYITCDDRLMRERPEAILDGARIMRHALHAKRCIIAIEDNKPEAFAALERAQSQSGQADIELVLVPTLYPTGGERQLIKVLTGKEVPSQGRTLDIGIISHNVTTAATIADAVIDGIPLINRMITVTGESITTPQNIRAPIGAPIEALLDFAGRENGVETQLVMGGPMMGISLNSASLPVIKTSNCFMLQPKQPTVPESPCIRCGECAVVCPAELLPQQLYWHSRAREFEKVQDYNLFDCIECGCCSYVCPSNIPLVHYYRFAKTEVWAQEREKEAANIARMRHEHRQARQEKAELEKQERMRKKKAALKDKEKGGTDDAAKKAAIKAAMDRAKAKREANQNPEAAAPTDVPSQEAAATETQPATIPESTSKSES